MSAVPLLPRTLQDPGPPPVPMKTLERWDQLLGSIAAGMQIQDAMLKHFMTRADIEACVRRSAEDKARWDQAKLASLKRTWTTFEIEEVLGHIALGKTIRDAIAEVKGPDVSQTAQLSFTKLVVADPDLRAQHEMALKSRAITLGEEVIGIADDDKDDVIVNEKGPAPNNAAVNRSKLKVDTRLRLMSGWFRDMFAEKAGNQVQVNVQVNHAARLEEARARARHKRASAPVPIEGEVLRRGIDRMIAAETAASVTPSAAKPDTDTSWLEG